MSNSSREIKFPMNWWRALLVVLQLLHLGTVNSQQGPPCVLPFFESDETCVDMCPQTHFGNGTSLRCEPYPPNYIVGLNSTFFCANFTVDIPLETKILNFLISINTTALTFPYDVIISLDGEDAFVDLFGFRRENGVIISDHTVTVPSGDLPIITTELSILYLKRPSSDVQLPIILSFTISVSHDPAQIPLTEPGKVALGPTMDPCLSSPCENNATCDVLEGAFQCICTPGYTGNLCDSEVPVVDVCQLICLNGGTCSKLFGEQQCTCPPGFAGDNCQIARCLTEVNVPLFPESAISYTWTEVQASIQQQPCPEACQELVEYPEGAVVRRECVAAEGAGAQWLSVDYTECTVDITTLKLCEANQLGSRVEVAITTANVIASTSQLESITITAASKIIENLTMAAIEDDAVRGPYLQIIDNVMEVNADVMLESRAESNSSARILQSLEIFTDSVSSQESGTAITMNNFAILIQDVDPANFTGEAFSADLGPVDEAVEGIGKITREQLVRMPKVIPDATASVELPVSLRQMTGRLKTLRSGTERLSFWIFLSNVLFLTPGTNGSICSIIISLRAHGCDGILQENLTLNFQKLSNVCGNREVGCSCANYDVTGAGQWSRENCRVVSEDDDECRCQCSQLGHFGLLFDLNPGAPLNPLALAIITYIGPGVSISCLIITIVTYCASKKLRCSAHGQLLVNLSVALIGLYTTFLVGGHVTSVPPLCGVVSAFLHYFILVFFGWTAAEAVLLYQKLVAVSGSHMHYFVAKAALIVWGTPMIVVAVSAGAGHDYYTNPFYCRPTEYPFWFGLVLPFLIIYFFNWIIFILIFGSLVRKMRKVKSENKDTFENVQKFTLIAIGLSLLFGLGWGLGLAATSSDVEEVTFTVQVIFSIFVGFQGLLIFIFHGVRSKEARKQWMSWLQWLPCLRRMAQRPYRPSQTRQSRQTPVLSSESFTYQMSTVTKSATALCNSPVLSRKTPEQVTPHLGESNDAERGEPTERIENETTD